ncbi:MAG: hypothetical protein GQ540_01335 [Lutibacter sp.]|uniref:hypothetical protein n=1 Tax=Lutibacter sp. TaxID=1925666 RepID=UPI001A00DDEF|nr:hypothetical protein [Lutibacter sp.]NOR27153.1 hypothetical protein [Lutibacter sp.]
MRYPLTFLIALLLVIFSSCRKDFSAELSSGNLIFSKDTVYLDTVFTNIGSSTYNLKVYNKSSNAISIPSIQLGKGENSFYRLNVDGTPGKIFEDVEILAKDSLYIFIETTIDYTQVTNPIYTDEIIFDNGENLQDVHLITLVKDAHFLFPSKDATGLIETINIGIDTDGNELNVNGFYLNDNTTFTNEKPYVVYGYCAVPENKTLTIEAGANIHFHSNSGLIVNKNATLTIEGELTNEVVIEGDRLEPHFSNLPGQWGAIWLRAGSKNHNINYAIIKNASAGIIMDSIGSNTSPTLTIKNTQIYNSSNFGILGRETNIEGENLVINNSGQASLACIIGGTYNFTHSTFANFWNNSLRQYPSVLINNFFTYDENNNQVIETRDLLAANFTNCIIDGNNNLELAIDKVEGSQFNYSFKNNLIRFNDFNNSYIDIPEYNFEDENHYSENILNGNADFKSPFTNELIIGENSEGIQNSNNSGTLLVPNDILGMLRSSPADIGAYQHIQFN